MDEAFKCASNNLKIIGLIQMILISEKLDQLRDIQVNNNIDKKIDRLRGKGLKNAIKLNLSYLNFLCDLIKIFRTSEDATVIINEMGSIIESFLKSKCYFVSYFSDKLFTK
jgi:hypothetical protein